MRKIGFAHISVGAPAITASRYKANRCFHLTIVSYVDLAGVRLHFASRRTPRGLFIVRSSMGLSRGSSFLFQIAEKKASTSRRGRRATLKRRCTLKVLIQIRIRAGAHRRVGHSDIVNSQGLARHSPEGISVILPILQNRQWRHCDYSVWLAVWRVPCQQRLHLWGQIDRTSRLKKCIASKKPRTSRIP
jgi:hypothetical protein